MKQERFPGLTALLVCAVLLFAACGGNASRTEDGTVTYTVTVVDTAGNPIEGVNVLLCDQLCVFAPTDASGNAVFRLEAGNYHASLMALPEGYAYVDGETEFSFSEGSFELTVTLKPAG